MHLYPLPSPLASPPPKLIPGKVYLWIFRVASGFRRAPAECLCCSAADGRDSSRSHLAPASLVPRTPGRLPIPLSGACDEFPLSLHPPSPSATVGSKPNRKPPRLGPCYAMLPHQMAKGKTVFLPTSHLASGMRERHAVIAVHEMKKACILC